jgi:TIR domain-containing protein/nucleotide-binding STING sensor domain-containing protein
MNVFVSYPSSVNWMVIEIFNQLPETVKPWIDSDKILIGSPIEAKIKENIENVDYVVCFLNEEALNSPWVKKELELASRREDDLGRSFILPVLLDNFPKESLPEGLRGRRFLTYQGKGYVRSIAAFANELTYELFRLLCERLDRPSPACEGIATVYFCCFIEPFSKMMRNAGELKLAGSNKFRLTVKPLQIQLCVVLPESLEDDLDEIRKRSRLQEGMLMEGEKRLFKVSYRASQDLQASDSITLYDFPVILNSVAKLYGQSRLDDWHRERPEWAFLIKQELSAFRIRLANLIGTLNLRVRSRIDVRSVSIDVHEG